MTTSRRDFLAASGAGLAGAGLAGAGLAGAGLAASGAALAGAGLAAAGPGDARPAAAAGACGRPALQDLSIARREAFVNRERARAVLAAENLDALVLARGLDVFYATNFFPLLERMSYAATAFAVLPRDPRRPVALVIPAFSHYYIQADDGLVPGVQPFVFTQPLPVVDGPGEQDGAARERAAETARTYPVVHPDLVTEREQRRRATIAAAAPFAPDAAAALGRALRELGLERGRLGFDHAAAAELVARAAPAASAVAAEDTLRRVRLVRTPAEIAMMRIAAENNVAAAHAAIAATRELGTLRAFRQRFYAEAALRGNLGVFMVVDAVSSDAYDAELRDGQAFMIDAVSHCRNFHGDYGRTVFVGEPHARIRRCTEAMATAWAEIRPRLRPGLRFSEIRALGRETLAKLGYDVPLSFGAHSVGLAHSDQPRSAPGGGPLDIALESDMVISVDVPLFETGNGGTAHFEDLVRITPQGGEIIHAVAPAAIVV